MHQATKQIGALDVVSKVRKSEASRHASTDPDGKKGGLGQASSRTWAWVGVETEGTHSEPAGAEERA